MSNYLPHHQLQAVAALISRQRFLSSIALFSLTAFLSGAGCTGASIPENESGLFEPKAISNLRAQGSFTIRFMLSINSVVVISDYDPDSFETSLSIDPSLLAANTNTIRTEFYLIKDNSERHSLAVAEQQVPNTQANTRVELNGLFYRYTDSDNDNRFDVHELGVSPTDIDNDGTDNVYDTDSDGDGLQDGSDATPYGISSLTPSQTPSFTLRYPDSQTSSAFVNTFIGETSEINNLVNTSSQLNFKSPATWPTANWPEINSLRGLTSYGLGSGSNSLCPQLRISFDTSSFRSSISQTSLLYFRRRDGRPFAAAIDDTELPDLNRFENTSLPLEGGWNDALRIILVPEGTVGWIELWTEPFFTGDVCRINVSAQR